MLPGLLLALATSATTSDLQTPAPDPIDTIVVEAAKLPGTAADIPTRVTIIDAEAIDSSLAQSLQDLVRYEPGIDVTDQGSRFGFSGFNIRGVSGNRVQIEVDGVANSDAFSIGSYSNASRDFVDISSVKQVEIVRGPASALFGSDAIGGVVSFITASPNDLLGNESHYLNAGTLGSSLDGSYTLRSSAAFRQGSVAGLFRVNSRHAQERDTGFNDPMNERALNLFTRFEIGKAGNGALDISLERYSNDGTTDVDSLERVQDFTAAFGFAYVIDTQIVEADDLRTRSRLSVGQEWMEGLFGIDFLRWRAYAQNSKTRQDTREVRSSVINGLNSDAERQRSFNFAQDLLGLEINAASDFNAGSVDHVLAYGIELERTKTDQIRAGIQTNLADGSQSNQVGPDLFPVRDFPKSTTERIGAYLQNSISIGSLTINPGLRWDRYKLDPSNDSIFATANPGITPVSISTDEVSPKIGLLWEISDSVSSYAQYSQGFRSPPVNDVNVGFTNFVFGYTTLPNPDLKSERSEGFEVGLRTNTANIDVDISVFQTRYADFIEPFQVVGFDSINNLRQFQSINIDAVRIQGAELSAAWRRQLRSGDLTFQLSAAYAKGDDLSADEALNSVAPLNAVVGIDYAAANGRWGLGVMLRTARGVEDLNETDGALLKPAGYAIADAFGFFRLSEKLRMRAGLYNLADTKYTAYLDVQGISAAISNPERFQRPGRYASVGLDWQF